jgi:hypothetical protein
MRTVFFVSVAVVALLTIPVAARAADMRVKAPPPAPMPHRSVGPDSTLVATWAVPGADMA